MGFKAAKCGTSLKMTMARIKVLGNKKELHIKNTRREIGELLANGQNDIASSKVERVINDQNTREAYDFIKSYCEFIVDRLSMIEFERDCPDDLKEAVAGLIFASKKCSDITELKDVRKHFTVKYRKDFIEAGERGVGVDPQVVRNLSAGKPCMNEKIKVLTSIAKEHNIIWDTRSLEEQHVQQQQQQQQQKQKPKVNPMAIDMKNEDQRWVIQNRTEIHGWFSCCNGCFSH